MIFIDSNIPMYVVGGAHRHKTDAIRLVEESVNRLERLVTDAGVFQEILHRYVAIGRRDAIQYAFDMLLRIVDEVFPIELGHVERAKNILGGYGQLSARDAIHLAVMEHASVVRIMSFDAGFDAYPGITRLGA